MKAGRKKLTVIPEQLELKRLEAMYYGS